ncbi:MAG: extracellular solute-binding protein [Clostridia bacterium]|nr:extracellular solute-binding protein [Clostridia bacterium]
MKKAVTLILLASMLAGTVSCGGTTPSGSEDTTASTTADTTTEMEEAYDFPELDMKGESLRILNSSTTWGFYTTLDLDESTGEALDDAVYSRNRNFEERYNVVLDITEENIDSTVETAKKVIMAGEDAFDVTWLRADLMFSMITDGYFTDLSEISTLNLDQPWWDQSVIENGSISADGSLYIASNYISFMGVQGSVCVFLNEDMFADLNLEKPYDMVREGTWTLDRLKEYAKVGANLNGEENWSYKKGAASTYGLVTWYDGIEALCIGSGWKYVEKDDKGIPQFVAGDEHFFDVADAVSQLCSTAGEFCEINNSSNGAHYEIAFGDGRSLMMIAEMKAASNLRDFDDTFGIVPIPKYDESQQDYITFVSAAQTLMSVPVTVKNPEQIGTLIDALAYMSYRDVLPVFNEVTVKQKELRNEESIEMLDYIHSSRYFDMCYAYGWTNNEVRENIRYQVKSSNGNVASKLESLAPGIKQRIQDTLDMMED